MLKSFLLFFNTYECSAYMYVCTWGACGIYKGERALDLLELES